MGGGPQSVRCVLRGLITLERVSLSLSGPAPQSQQRNYFFSRPYMVSIKGETPVQ